MSENFFEINDIKDLGRIIFFFIISPVIGLLFFIGMVGTSSAILFTYIKDFIKEKVL